VISTFQPKYPMSNFGWNTPPTWMLTGNHWIQDEYYSTNRFQPPNFQSRIPFLNTHEPRTPTKENTIFRPRNFKRTISRPYTATTQVENPTPTRNEQMDPQYVSQLEIDVEELATKLNRLDPAGKGPSVNLVSIGVRRQWNRVPT